MFYQLSSLSLVNLTYKINHHRIHTWTNFVPTSFLFVSFSTLQKTLHINICCPTVNLFIYSINVYLATLFNNYQKFEWKRYYCSCLEINHVSNYSRITGACLFPGKSTLMAQSPPKVADVSEKAVLPLHFIYVPEKPDTVVLKRN